MSRAAELLDKFLEGDETPEEGDELARLLREEEALGAELVDRVMLEVDLYETCAGIAELRVGPPRRGRLLRPLPLAAVLAALLLIGLLILL